MNKKFLSAILFGALMVTSTGTFVSCKDYDDDIDNLQTQIDKLATKEDMTSQIASLQSALSSAASEAAAAKTAAADALAKATASEKAAAQAALDAAAAKEEAIKAAQDEVAKVKAELETAIDAKFEASKKELAATIAKLTEKVENLTGYTTEMLTSLHIVYTEPVYTENQDKTDIQYPATYTGYSNDAHLDLNYARIPSYGVEYPKDFNYSIATEARAYSWGAYEFGKGMPGAFVVTPGDVNTVKDNMIVNVAPVNAAVSAESLSLINSKGESVNEYVDFTIANYDELLSGSIKYNSRSVATTGLREVGVQLKNTVDFEKFDKMVLNNAVHDANHSDCYAYEHDYILHALAVTDAKGRKVNSDFEVTMHVQNERKAEYIQYASVLSSSAYLGENGESQLYNHFESEDGLDEIDCFPIVINEAFTLDVRSYYGRVMASYVVFDLNNPTLSTTDKAALRAVTVTGNDVVVKDGRHTLTVGGYAEGLTVPLKLVTIDYTGNIEVYPFWVKAETPALMTAEFTMTPISNVEDATAWTPEVAESSMEAFTIPAGAATYDLHLIASETAHVDEEDWNEFHVVGGTVSHTAIEGLKFYKSNKTQAPGKLAEVAYAVFTGELNLQIMREDKAYEGVVKFYASNGSYLGSNAIKVKKVLPTAIPAGLSAKQNAIQADGTLKVYPVPGTNVGKFDLVNSFNFSDELLADANLTFNTPSFNPGWTTYASYSNRTIVNIQKDVIGSDSKFPTTVKYNYGDIKFQPEGHGVQDASDCVVTWSTKFDLQFGCLPVDSKYEWYVTPKVYYRESVLLEAPIYDEDGVITGYNDVIKVTDPYAKVINAFSNNEANGWAPWAKALPESATIELWTNGDKNKVDEFFTANWKVANGKTGIELVKTSTEVVLTGDVEITVVLNIVDNFNHTHQVKALTFTMKKDHSGDAK